MSAQIFDRMGEAVVLLAAMFTIAWMQRNNEQLPLLSAGVSARRVVRPIIASACLMLGLTAVNQEILIPQIGLRLLFQRDDPDGDKDVEIKGTYEPNGIHIEGKAASRQTQVVKDFRCTIPPEIAGSLIHLTATEAQ